MTLKGLLAAARTQPWATTRLLWSWEWHALIVWLLFATIVAPTLALVLKPALQKTQARLKRRASQQQR